MMSKQNVAWVLGFGTLIAGGVAVVMSVIVLATLIGPLVFWFAWNVLDLGESVGLGDLGLWAIVLATFFLVVGWFGKVVVAALVMLIDPTWFQAEATLTWPEPTFKNLIAIALLAVLAAFPHSHNQQSHQQHSRKQQSHQSKSNTRSRRARGDHIIDVNVR